MSPAYSGTALPRSLSDLEFNGKPYEFGAMPRNITELIGVFGSVDVSMTPSGYASSLRMEGMIDLENVVKRLKSPRWPEHILPPIDVNLANAGRALYTSTSAMIATPFSIRPPNRRQQ